MHPSAVILISRILPEETESSAGFVAIAMSETFIASLTKVGLHFEPTAVEAVGQHFAVAGADGSI